MAETPLISIIIPTLDRKDCLKKCVDSIEKQTYRNYEVLTIRGEGELANLRNKGLKRAQGSIVIFIDDDVEVTPKWLESIVEVFKREDIVGVSGPAVIRAAYRNNRDIFKYKWAKKIHDFLFLEGKSHLPGRITKAGTWTTGATEEGCSYEGEVDFLEACNMAFRKKEFLAIGGFDENYRGIGDWSEPDAAYRIKSFGKLWFTKGAKLFHNPSKTGAFIKRKRTGARLQNYYLFSTRWVRPHWRHTLFKWFIRSYYGLKDRGLI